MSGWLATRRLPPVPGWVKRWLALWLGILVGLALTGGFVAGLSYARGGLPFGPPGAAAATAAPAAPDDYALLTEIRGLIESEYYRPAKADPQKLLYGAANGMIQALGDPYSAYEPPPDRAVNDSRWTGRYDGIGVYLDQKDSQVVVTAAIEGSPAERAGLQAGDVIVEVDGRPLSGLSPSDQILAIRGPRGSTVTLGIRRGSSPSLLRIVVVRDQVRLVSTTGELLPNGLGLLRITQFTEGTPAEARDALERLLAQHPAGLLLDLRGNPGGLLEPAVQVAGYFLGDGPVVLEQHADGEQKTYDAPDDAPLTTLPLLVLVDRGSASASEVLAAALRDRGRALLVGERTFGKNTVQYIHRLSDGSGLRITVAEWHTPSGQLIPSTGLDPDWPVAKPDQTLAGDAILDAAAQHLLAGVARPNQ